MIRVAYKDKPNPIMEAYKEYETEIAIVCFLCIRFIIFLNNTIKQINTSNTDNKINRSKLKIHIKQSKSLNK